MKNLLKHFFLYLYHKRKNGNMVKFSYSSYISHRSYFEGMNMVGDRAAYHGKMGYGSYIGANTHLNADIGRFSSIGPNVKVVNATHPMKEPIVTTSPLFFSLDRSKNPLGETFAKKQLFEEFRYYDKERGIDIKVGNDCWIGEGVTFIGGVEVNDGGVVLAGAYVVKDVPAFAIVGGVPAKVIGYRYDDETIALLLRVKWWNNTKSWFEKNWNVMCNMQEFKKMYEA